MQHWDKDGHKEHMGRRGVSISLNPDYLHLRWFWVCTFDLVESLRYESLDGFETLHHKAQSGKLTAAVWDQLIGQRLWKDLLQAKRLESSEGRTCRRSGWDHINNSQGFPFFVTYFNRATSVVKRHLIEVVIQTSLMCWMNHYLLSHHIILKQPFSLHQCVAMHHSGQFKSATSPIRRSSSWRTSTASLMLTSGSIRVSQALRMELGVISENFARKTCKLGFTRKRT